MVNKVILLGNLGKDPELRHTQGGTAVVNFSMATSRRVKDRDGNWGDETDWHNIVVWGKAAEAADKYLSKGSRVFVEGRLQTRSWEDQEGQKRYKTEVVAEGLKYLSSSNGSKDNAPDVGDNDIPF